MSNRGKVVFWIVLVALFTWLTAAKYEHARFCEQYPESDRCELEDFGR